MTRHIRRHCDVSDDIVEIASYIAQDDTSAATRFIDAVETTLKWLVNHPKAGALRLFDDPRLAAVRSWPVGRFRNHLIFYEVASNGIYVLAVIHGARNLPRVLRGRNR